MKLKNMTNDVTLSVAELPLSHIWENTVISSRLQWHLSPLWLMGLFSHERHCKNTPQPASAGRSRVQMKVPVWLTYSSPPSMIFSSDRVMLIHYSSTKRANTRDQTTRMLLRVWRSCSSLPWTTPHGYCLALTVLFPTFTSSTLPTTAKGRWA